MAFLQEKKFEFRSQALGEDAFAVVRFKGTEGLSRCYEFVIDLVSQDAAIDMTAVLKNPATFTILRDDGNIPFHGILTDFEQLQEIDGYVFYRAVLVPKLWWLSLTFHNQVLLDKKVPDMLEEILKDGGLTSLDFELRLNGEYAKWDYICQYGESHLNFVSRWMEREGIYYYFEQGESSEKVIVTDEKMSHEGMSEGTTMYYSPPSALGESHREEIINAFICRQTMLPKTLRLRDYNYETPSMELAGSAEVSADGRGEIYIYGEHFRTVKEGNALAKIRAEEYLCRERRFHGESTIPYLRPGYLFNLEDHYRSDVNRQYLTTEMEHEGTQASYLIAGIRKDLHDADKTPYYRNSFVAIQSDVQFRPPVKTTKPRFYGTLNARIDGAGTGKYAELDDQGRYKVVLPFDESGRTGGKASAFLRMAQPYAGTDHGMHFPLHKGTEVLLTFIDGDPDRPLVAAAVPNPETPSPVTSADQTMSKITTSGGNKIHMEDEEGNQRILLQTPSAKTFFRIGSVNDPPTDNAKAGFWGASLVTAEGYNLKAGFQNKQILGESTTMITGANTTIIGGFNTLVTAGNDNKFVGLIRTDTTVGMRFNFRMGGEVTYSPLYHQFRQQKIRIGEQEVTVGGDGVKIYGNVTNVTGDKTKVSGNVTTVNGDDTTVKGDATNVTGDHTEVKGDATTVSGNQTTVQGDATTVSGNNTTVNGDATTVSGDVTTVAGNVTTVSGAVDTVTSAQNVISAENVAMSASTIMM